MTETDRIIDYNVPKPTRPKLEKVEKGYYRSLYKPEYAETASRLAAVGFSCDDIAYSLGVPSAAIANWKNTIPEFKTVWRNGKHDQLRRLVAKGLLEAAGYNYETKRIEINRDADGEIKGTKEITFQNHQPLQPNALIFLICNLSSQLGLSDDVAWKSRQKMEVESKSINLTISGELVSEQITKLAGKLLGQPETKQIETIDAVFESKAIRDGPTIARDEPQDKNDSESELQGAEDQG